MRKTVLVMTIVTFAASSLVGCANMTETQSDTAKGAGIGAVAGAVIGAATGGRKGAAAGAAIGAAAGAGGEDVNGGAASGGSGEVLSLMVESIGILGRTTRRARPDGSAPRGRNRPAARAGRCGGG